MFKSPVVIIGIGQLGGVIAKGYMKLGHPVYPVTRNMNLTQLDQQLKDPEAVILATGESSLPSIFNDIPHNWQAKLVLIQNELLPKDWETQLKATPTVSSIWFEKKAGMDSKPLLPSPVKGSVAKSFAAALKAVDLPASVIDSDEELLYELVRKNIYILTSNICGLRTGGTMGELKDKHTDFMQAVAAEVLEVQNHLAKTNYSLEKMLVGLDQAIEADPEHRCMGRSAAQRLKRFIDLADSLAIQVAVAKDIAKHNL